MKYGRPLYFCMLFLLFFFFYSWPNLSGRRVDVYHTHTFCIWCDLNANLGCRSEMCCTQLAGIQDAKNRHLGTIAQLCWAVSSQLRHVSIMGKNLLSSNTSLTCSRSMVNFDPLTAEIGSGVWDTPASNRGRQLYSAGRPSRWALAHILVGICYNFDTVH